MAVCERMNHKMREAAQNESISSSYEKHSKGLFKSDRQTLNSQLANPLAGFGREELRIKGRNYAITHSLTNEEDIKAFEIGAILAQDPERFEDFQSVSAEDMEILKKESTNRWSQPKLLYLIIVLCSTCAAVQGMGK